MTHNFQDSPTNIKRTDRPDILAEKLIGPSSIASFHNHSSPEAAYPIGKIVPPVDCVYLPNTPEDNLPKDEKLPRKSIHDCPYMNQSYSDLNGTQIIDNTALRYSILPRFGLKEQGTQTMLTNRDIDDLEEIKKNLSSSREEYLRGLFKSSNDIMRKVLDTAYFHPSLPFDEPLARDVPLDFLSLKRQSDMELPYPCSRMMKSSPQKTLDTVVQIKPCHKRMRRRKRTQDNSAPKRGQKSVENSKPHEERTVSDMIHEIKNPSKKEAKNNTEPQAQVSSMQGNKSVTSTSSNSNCRTPFEISSIVNGKRKFDAYHFFKAEYMTSNLHKSEEELERDCKKEWNSLDKEVKKLYNINAERERKNHKLKRKMAKEQMKLNLDGTR